MRFHGAGRTDVVSRDYAHADGDLRVALVARLGDRVVAVAGYDRLNEPGVAEVAFAVADDMQGRGLATRMLEQLAEVGAERGVRRFDAEVIADNRAMLHVFSSAGFGMRRETAWGEAHLELDIRPSERAEERMAERHHRADGRLAAPGARARVGRRRRRVGARGQRRRRAAADDHRGRLRRRRGGGEPRRRGRLLDPRGAVDRRPARPARARDRRPCPAAEVLDAVVEAADAGARGVLVVATGFSDTDEPEGREREEALLAAARARGVRLVGPNSIGLVNTDPAVDAARAARRGRHARRAASRCRRSPGALGLALLGHAAARRLGVAAFVSLGNRADVSTNDLLEYWADDPRCTVIALYVESFGNPRRFSQVSRRVSRLKPILAVKGNRTRRVAVDALSHTAAALRRRGRRRRAAAPGRACCASRAPRRCSTPPSCSSASRCRAGATSASSRTPAASGGSRATRARRAASSSPCRPPRRSPRLAERAPAAPTASRTRSTSACARRSTDYLTATGGLLDDDGVDAVIVVHAGRSGLEQRRGPGRARGGDRRRREAGRRLRRRPRRPAGRARALDRAELPLPRGGRPRARARRRPPRLAVAPARPAPGPRRRRRRGGAADRGRRARAAVPAGSTTRARPRCSPRTACRSLAAEPTARRRGGRRRRRARRRARRAQGRRAGAGAPGDIDAVLLGLEGEAAVRAGWEALRRRVAAAGRGGRARSSSRSSPAGADVLVGAVADPDLGAGRRRRDGRPPGRPRGRRRVRARPAHRRRGRRRARRRRPACGRGSTARAAPPPLDRPALRDLVLRFARLLEHVPEIAEADLNAVRVTAERRARARRAGPRRAAAGAAAREDVVSYMSMPPLTAMTCPLM